MCFIDELAKFQPQDANYSNGYLIHNVKGNNMKLF